MAPKTAFQRAGRRVIRTYLPSFWAHLVFVFFLVYLRSAHICPLLLNILWFVVFHTCTFWGPEFCIYNVLFGIWDGVTPLVYLVYFMPTSENILRQRRLWQFWQILVMFWIFYCIALHCISMIGINLPHRSALYLHFIDLICTAHFVCTEYI